MPTNINIYIAILGLLLVVVEIYFPRVSTSTERFLNKLQLFFLNISFDFKEWGESFYEKIKASKFLAKTFSISLVFMVVFIPFIIVLALIKNFISEEFSKTVFRVASYIIFPFVLCSIPMALFIYGSPFFWVFIHAIRFPFYLVSKIFKLFNVIGNGRALSGIGILIALWGLITTC